MIVHRTGPLFITKVMPIYLAYSSIKDMVYLAPSYAFSPLVDPGKVRDFITICKLSSIFLDIPPNVRKLCQRILQFGNSRDFLRNAILHHKFLHLGYSHNRASNFFDACGTFPFLVRYRLDAVTLIRKQIRPSRTISWFFSTHVSVFFAMSLLFLVRSFW